jgi:hypothetical protein
VVSQVQLTRGGPVTVDNSELVSLLREGRDRAALESRLAALNAALAEVPVSVNVADQARLAEILNRPPFAERAEPNPLLEFFRPLLEFFERLFTRTTRGIFETRDLFVLGGIVAVFAVLAYLVVHLRRSAVADQALAAEGAPDEAASSSEALVHAQRLANAGDYRSAARQLYLAALLYLDERGRVRYDRSLTNKEYLTIAGLDAPAVHALEPVVERFDRTWYGFEPMTAEDFEAFRRQIDELERV